MKRIFLTAFLGLAANASASVLFTNGGGLVNDADQSIVSSPAWGKGDTDTGTLYFQYTVIPLSDSTSENYFAALQLYQGGGERLAVGNAWGPYAYSAYNTASGTPDLNSATPEAGQSYQLVRSTDLTTLVFRVDYNSGADDNVTVWLNPDLGTDEASQNPALVTTFVANASFDEIVLREGDNGNGTPDGWNFSNIRVADQSSDIFAVPEPSTAILLGLVSAALLRRRR